MSNLKERLREKGELQSDMPVADLLGNRLIVRGFIINNPVSLEAILTSTKPAIEAGPFLGKAHPFSNRVIDIRGGRWMLFSSVRKPDIEEIDLRTSFIPGICMKSQSCFDQFTRYVRWDHRKLDLTLFEGVRLTENGYIYTVHEDDLLFTSESIRVGVGKGFAALCYRLNDAGEVSYEIHSAEELVPLPQKS